jgi:hypothetical protein
MVTNFVGNAKKNMNGKLKLVIYLEVDGVGYVQIRIVVAASVPPTH